MSDNGILIVIVSYNSRHLMQECVKSIRINAAGLEYKLVAVDNASTDLYDTDDMCEFDMNEYI